MQSDAVRKPTPFSLAKNLALLRACAVTTHMYKALQADDFIILLKKA